MCLAVPGKIQSIAPSDSELERIGRVEFGPLIKEINLAFVPEAKQGDHVIVHAGFAIAVLTLEEALPIYDTYRERAEQG